MKPVKAPEHVAFIMDGNGRWAESRHMPREFGHRAGARTLRRILRHCNAIGIKYVTVYAFSTENWKRPKEEVSSIMDLVSRYLDEVLRDMEKNRMRVKVLGDIRALDEKLQQKIIRAEKESESYSMTLNIALNYGARAEITQALASIVRDGYREDQITQELISSRLYTAHCPDPDLIIRTAGEERLSNFLLWQAAYSEFCFTQTLWPDFSARELDSILHEFESRTRRFGAVVKSGKEG